MSGTAPKANRTWFSRVLGSDESPHEDAAQVRIQELERLLAEKESRIELLEAQQSAANHMVADANRRVDEAQRLIESEKERAAALQISDVRSKELIGDMQAQLDQARQRIVSLADSNEAQKVLLRELEDRRKAEDAAWRNKWVQSVEEAETRGRNALAESTRRHLHRISELEGVLERTVAQRSTLEVEMGRLTDAHTKREAEMREEQAAFAREVDARIQHAEKALAAASRAQEALQSAKATLEAELTGVHARVRDLEEQMKTTTASLEETREQRNGFRAALDVSCACAGLTLERWLGAQTSLALLTALNEAPELTKRLSTQHLSQVLAGTEAIPTLDPSGFEAPTVEWLRLVSGALTPSSPTSEG